MKRKTKKILKITLAILTPFILICLFFALLLFPVRGITYRVADGVTAEGIKKIELGITKEEVFAILGEPIKIDTYNIVLSYTKQYFPFVNQPQFWIQLDSNNCVSYIRVGWSDAGAFYLLLWERENLEYTGENYCYINEELLYKYFK